MESNQEKRKIGRPKLSQPRNSRKEWERRHKRIWLTNEVYENWQMLKSQSIYSSDSAFARHLLSLEFARLESLQEIMRANEAENVKQSKEEGFTSSTSASASTTCHKFDDSDISITSHHDDSEESSLVDITEDSSSHCLGTTIDDTVIDPVENSQANNNNKPRKPKKPRLQELETNDLESESGSEDGEISV